MTEFKVANKNLSVCVLYLHAQTSSFTVAAIREESAHFCRYSCAPNNIK